ncbi:MAG: HD domain-containing protein [Candidatus Omnitrophica bacterium]|nr:HD domain-containing protein [Candidatus Omnitrophota bacterium]
MFEKIEEALRGLLACLQVVKLYTNKHPLFAKTLDKAYLSLNDALQQSPELTLGIIGEELVFEKEIFFDLSKNIRPAIIYLKNRGIEKIIFSRGFSKEELEKFVLFLASPKEESSLNPQERLSLSGIKNIRVDKINAKSIAASPAQEDAKKYLGIYDSSLEKALHTVTDILEAKSIDHLSLQFTISNLMDNLTKLPQEFLKLISIKRHDVATYAHAMNVSILAMHFSAKLGFTKEDVLDIGVAGLFHDIGKLYISQKLLRKPDRLTDEEFQTIRSHTLLGAQILLNYQESLGILPVVVSFEHHLRYDMQGYPKLAYLKKPHLASLIVSVCDVYDALYQRRGYKMDYSPDVIYNIMSREKGTAFEPALLDNFFKAVGVWPIGSIVALTDGRIAVVRQENEADIFLPKVEVIFPVDKKELIDLKDNESGIKIERFLSPWKEGKEFLSLV